jgi:drug/metabolite transporter (DMT)-like permease
MSLTVLIVLIFAAALHAGWNAAVKKVDDREAAAIAVAAGGGVIAIGALPLLPPMAPEAFVFVIVTSLVHILYFALLARAYRGADLSVAYPLMRGLAPILVTGFGAVVLSEYTGVVGFLGIVLVSLGVIALGLEGLRAGRSGRPAIGAALLNAAIIASYTLVDGVGVRLSGEAATYAAWVMLASGVTNASWVLLRQGAPMARRLARHAGLGLVGGAMSGISYGLALWAMTVAPIAFVSAVRETSVLFAAALGATVLHERFGALRWAAAAVVVAGLVAVKAGGSL